MSTSMAGTEDPDDAALLATLTPREQAALCSGQDYWQTQALERIGLPAVFLADGPHGLRKPEGDPREANIRGLPATCFPSASALACSWDRELLREIGAALAAECLEQRVGMLLGPGINIKRSPLCGRNFEYYSEDPLLGGELAAAWIAGLQSRGVSACLKHYAVNNQETRRMLIDAVLDERALREIYLRGFEIAVRRAQPGAVMAAYNRVNGVFCSENAWLLEQVLRREWGFGGLVVSDWGAVNDRVAGLQAGLDLEMPSSGGLNEARILAALADGTLEPAVLARAATRVLGFARRAARLPRPDTPFDRDAHHALATRAASAGAVLLKNDGALLPLAADARIAVLGEFAHAPRYQGTGSSQITPTRLDSPLAALAARGIALRYAQGYRRDTELPDETLIEEACRVARDADVAVVFAGLPEGMECEAVDRRHMRLPPAHDRLVERVCAANPRTVVVLQCGAPVELPWLERVPALFAAYLGGQGGGSAIAALLLGETEPSGRLAESWPLALADLPSSAHFPGAARTVEYRESIYVGYRWFASARRALAFPFGHGLGYTRFGYSPLELSATRIAAGMELQVALSVTNLGTRPGIETVQLYTGGPGNGRFRPALELRDFARTALAPGESRRVEFLLDERAFALFETARGAWITEHGTHRVLAGASSADIRAAAELWIDSPHLDPPDARLAQEAPSYFQPADALPGHTRAEFSALLGHAPPTGDAPGEFDLNSMLGELRTTWLGALLYHVTLFGARRMARRSQDAVLERMMEQLTAEMPLRQLVVFSGGALDFAMAEALLTIMNGQRLAGLRALIAAARARRR